MRWPAARLWALLIAVVVAAGCTNMDQKTDARMHKVLGLSLADIVKKWGPPAGQRTVDGRKLVTWKFNASGKDVAPPSGTYCNSTVEFNDKDIAVGYYWDGNDCAAAAGHL